MMHAIERGLIHYFAACSLVLAVFFALSYWQRRNRKVDRWLPDDEEPLLVMSALIVFAISALREPIDVAMGQSVGKAISDFASWLLGAGTAAWGLYRLRVK